MSGPRLAPPLAIVVKGYPRLSETFIAQEFEGLERAGLDFDIWSLRRPTDAAEHPVHGRIRARRRYLPEYLHDAPGRVALALLSQVWRPRFWRAARVWLRDLRRDPTRNRMRRFGQAAVLARELPAGTRFLYVHFLHTPASVARYAAMLRGIGWGFSAHAKDIWTIPDWEKREKIADAAFGVTCTAYGAAELARLDEAGGTTALVYHGLDLDRLPDPPEREAGPALRLLSVGRLVEKKGYDTLLDALALLPADLDWRLVHIGGGTLSGAMRERAATLDLAACIEWRGAQDREAVFAAMAEADLFVLPSRIAADGDRDGLPNVLMEAASQQLPILSTAVAAIPEFVTDGETGTLVPPDDPPALAAALTRLAAAPADRAAMAERLHARLHADFSAEAGIETVARHLREGIAR